MNLRRVVKQYNNVGSTYYTEILLLWIAHSLWKTIDIMAVVVCVHTTLHTSNTMCIAFSERIITFFFIRNWIKNRLQILWYNQKRRFFALGLVHTSLSCQLFLVFGSTNTLYICTFTEAWWKAEMRPKMVYVYLEGVILDGILGWVDTRKSDHVNRMRI